MPSGKPTISSIIANDFSNALDMDDPVRFANVSAIFKKAKGFFKIENLSIFCKAHFKPPIIHDSNAQGE